MIAPLPLPSNDRQAVFEGESRPAGVAFLRLGFRPFYLAGAIAAVVSMLCWAAIFASRMTIASGLAPVLWHAHEMLFGVVAAFIVGFLLTAGKVWTHLPTPRGRALLALLLCWSAARLAAVIAPYAIFFLFDAAFLPLISAIFLRRLVQSRNWRNLPVAAVLSLLSIVNIVFHLAANGLVDLDPAHALRGGLALIIVLETIIAGRVIPAFTASALPGVRIATDRTREWSVLACTSVGLGLWAFGAWRALGAGFLVVAAVLHVWRLASWLPGKTVRRPILFVLHAAYAWIPAGLSLLALATFFAQPESAAIHALAVGATGGLILAMITRTARGHTGRELQASPGEVAAYVCVAAAALFRVTASLGPAGAYVPQLVIAGALWIGAFSLYLGIFAPWLMSARVDGRDG